MTYTNKMDKTNEVVARIVLSKAFKALSDQLDEKSRTFIESHIIDTFKPKTFSSIKDDGPNLYADVMVAMFVQISANLCYNMSDFSSSMVEKSIKDTASQQIFTDLPKVILRTAKRRAREILNTQSGADTKSKFAAYNNIMIKFLILTMSMEIWQKLILRHILNEKYPDAKIDGQPCCNFILQKDIPLDYNSLEVLENYAERVAN